MGLLLAPQNWPFAMALALVAVMGLIQVLMLVFGGMLDGLDMDADADLDVDGGSWAGAMDWLHVGRLPFSILLMLCGLSFGLPGLFIQSVAKAQTDGYLPTGLVSGLALLAAIPGVRLGGTLLRKILPRDETEAVSVDSLIGSEAVITIGTARRGQPAEARVYDSWGKAQYIMVEPEKQEDVFPAGSTILLLSRQEHIFRAIDNSPNIVAPLPSDSVPATTSPKGRPGQREAETS